MKRIAVWIDIDDEDVELVRMKLRRFFAKTGLTYKILEPSDLIELENE